MHPAYRTKAGRIRRWLIAGIAGLFGATGCAYHPPQVTAAAPPPPPACHGVQVPVTIPHAGKPGQITGDLCEPHNDNGTVLLLVAGGGEDADYWNMPGLAGYSLVTAAAKHGFATLAIDRVGTGRSTIPQSSTLVTYAAQVATVDQVVAALRHNRSAFGRTWGTVIGVGHSLGSGTLAGVAAEHQGDLDAMILTGYGAAVTPQTSRLDKLYRVAARTVAARWSALDPGYVTVVPTAVEKIGLLYGPGTSDTALAAVSAHQGTLSDTELSSGPQGAAASQQAARITIPVLVADGQYDRHYCEGNDVDAAPSLTPACQSAAAFDAYAKKLLPNACLASDLVANSGHAIQEEEAAPAANSMYLAWIMSTTYGGYAHCVLRGPDNVTS
jgi:pimeloyl-ACP methyl ester carboxylesterase